MLHLLHRLWLEELVQLFLKRTSGGRIRLEILPFSHILWCSPWNCTCVLLGYGQQRGSFSGTILAPGGLGPVLRGNTALINTLGHSEFWRKMWQSTEDGSVRAIITLDLSKQFSSLSLAPSEDSNSQLNSSCFAKKKKPKRGETAGNLAISISFTLITYQFLVI